MIDCIEVFSTFNAIKLHFSGKFDIRKYGFNLKRFNGDALFKSHQEHVCRKLADRYQTADECRTIFAANLVRDPTKHITRVDDKVAETLRRYNANKQILIDDIFSELSHDLFTRVKNGVIIEELYKGDMSLELFCFMNKFIPVVNLVDTYHKSDYAWKLLKERIDKLSPFCRLNSKDQLDEIRGLILNNLKPQTER